MAKEITSNADYISSLIATRLEQIYNIQGEFVSLKSKLTANEQAVSPVNIDDIDRILDGVQKFKDNTRLADTLYERRKSLSDEIMTLTLSAVIESIARRLVKLRGYGHQNAFNAFIDDNIAFHSINEELIKREKPTAAIKYAAAYTNIMLEKTFQTDLNSITDELVDHNTLVAIMASPYPSRSDLHHYIDDQVETIWNSYFWNRELGSYSIHKAAAFVDERNQVINAFRLVPLVRSFSDKGYHVDDISLTTSKENDNTYRQTYEFRLIHVSQDKKFTVESSIGLSNGKLVEGYTLIRSENQPVLKLDNQQGSPHFANDTYTKKMHMLISSIEFAKAQPALASSIYNKLSLSGFIHQDRPPSTNIDRSTYSNTYRAISSLGI